MNTALDPRTFLSHLSEGRPVVPTSVIGLVKPAEQRDALLLSLSGKCERWITIPIDMIGSITPLHEVPCGDHMHPLVSIVLREPGEDEHGAKLFAALLRESFSALAMASQCQENPLFRSDSSGPRETCKQHCRKYFNEWICSLVCQPRPE